ncbi:MAG TPA: gas vesicle protein GvpD, partial [Methanothrix sp.]|nr:gas vesicle protein GvpD [Methanothrix sp.]
MQSSEQTSIPKEIIDFFHVDKGQTLLIKGMPGTGKTTLALEIMSCLCQERNGLYISTRVDPRRLYATNPWIEEVLVPRNVVNATQTKLLESLRKTGKDLSNYYAVLDFFRVFFEETEEMDDPMIIIDSWDAVLNYTTHLIGSSQHSFEQNICEFARDLDTHLIFVSEFA